MYLPWCDSVNYESVYIGLMDKTPSMISFVLVYQQLICAMPGELQEKYMGIEEVVHVADR